MVTSAYLDNMRYVYEITLDSFDKIKQFIHFMDSVPDEIYLFSNNRIITAHSVMGIFTLDLVNPILLYSNTHLMEEPKYSALKIRGL